MGTRLLRPVCFLAVVLIGIAAASVGIGRTVPGAGVIAYSAVNRQENLAGDIYLLDIAHALIRNLTESPERSELNPAWSHDGSALAYFIGGEGREPNGLCIVQFGSREYCYEEAARFANLAWSPVELKLAFTTSTAYTTETGSTGFQDFIGVMNVTHDGITREASLPYYALSEITWAAGGDTIAFEGFYSDQRVFLNRALQRWSVQTGQIELIEPRLPDIPNFEETVPRSSSASVPSSPVYSPDGRTIAISRVINGVHRILLVDAATLEARYLADAGRYQASFAWSPDGTSLLLVTDQQADDLDLYLVNISTGDKRALTNNQRISDTLPAWSPDGSQIAFISNRERQNAIYLINATTSDSAEHPAARIVPPRLIYSHPAWMPVP